MVTSAFNFLSTQKLIFGAGKISELPSVINNIGSSVLLIIGNSFRQSDAYEALLEGLEKKEISVFETITGGEPSPESIDMITSEFRKKHVHAVAAIGGGSVLDTGKAVSAMLPRNESVFEFIEKVGTKKHDGIKAPFVAIPTTAGTGSEATNNSVISRVGKDGFKRSLRHDNLIPDVALIDPELTLSCPPEVTAASGLDALTQLIEAYVSPKASPLSDAIAFSGLEQFKESFIPVCGNKSGDIAARSGMAYAAYASGVSLTNAGLGTVHGFAPVIGSYFDIPHGVICGTLLAETIRETIHTLGKIGTSSSQAALDKYSRIGILLTGKTGSVKENCDQLVSVISDWIKTLGLPSLKECGIRENELDRIAEETDNKNNPAILDKETRLRILKARW